MLHQKNFYFLFLSFLMLSFTASAQLTSSNSLGIFPAAQVSINPNGKFTAIGESGGVVGPTADGCDIYGFRSQVALNRNINLGMRRVNFFSGLDIPNLQFESNVPFWITEKGGVGGSEIFGCSSLLAFFKGTTGGAGGNNVFTLIGSGTASGGIWQASDRQLKRDITTIPNAIDIVKQLNGVSYEYRTDERPELNLPQGRNYGFITQEVSKIMPEAVRDAIDPMGEVADYDVMQYTQIIPVLTEAIKEQQTIIDGQDELLDSQQNTINELEEKMAKMDAMLTQLMQANDLSLPTNTTDGVSLKQNRPNPFSGSTTIEYTLPRDVSNAQLIVYNINGVAVRTITISDFNGSVEFDASGLASGTYIYSIEVNGNSLARETMVVK